MLNGMIRGSLHHRWGVVAAAVVLLVAGGALTAQLPVDVFPDLTAPTVTVITEANGLAPEEVELLVTFPIESALNGASGVRRIRSVSVPASRSCGSSSSGGEDIYLARQVVTERLQTRRRSRRRRAADPRPDQLDHGRDHVHRPHLRPASRRWSCASSARRSSAAACSRCPASRRSCRSAARSASTWSSSTPRRSRRPGSRSRTSSSRSRRRAPSRRPASTSTGARSTWSAASAAPARSRSWRRTVLRVRDGIPLRLGQVATVRPAPEPARGTASYRASRR